MLCSGVIEQPPLVVRAVRAFGPGLYYATNRDTRRDGCSRAPSTYDYSSKVCGRSVCAETEA